MRWNKRGNTTSYNRNLMGLKQFNGIFGWDLMGLDQIFNHDAVKQDEILRQRTGCDLSDLATESTIDFQDGPKNVA